MLFAAIFDLLDDLFLPLNAVVCARSFLIILRAWPRLRDTAIAGRLGVALLLNAIYLVGYVVILVGVVDRLRWSQVLVGVAPLTWWFVWPALSEVSVAALDQAAEHTHVARAKLTRVAERIDELHNKVDR